MPEPVVRVTVEDVASGEKTVRMLDPDEVIWVVGKQMYQDGLTKYGNGTMVVTFKRKIGV